MTSYLLALDLGTSGLKACLFDESLTLVASSTHGYPTSHPAPGSAEQNPDDWLGAVSKTCQELRQHAPDFFAKIAAVGLSGHMNGCVAVDAAGRALRPAIIHADLRSQPQCSAIAARLSEKEYYSITGNRLVPQSSIGKFLWLKETEPEVYARSRWLVQSKDYLRSCLTGEAGFTDHSDASLTGLLDLNGVAWSEEVCEAATLDSDKLPELHASAEVVGRVSAAAARLTGIRAGTPVVVGGGDGACATAGCGAVNRGDAYVCLGSTAWVMSISEKPVFDPQMRLFNVGDLRPAVFNVVMTVQNAGAAHDWFVRGLCADETREKQTAASNCVSDLTRMAARVPPGSNDLVFLPYLSGERGTIWDPKARGVFFGLTLEHGRPEMLRAVLEGVAFGLRQGVEAMKELGVSIDSCRLIGGGARNILWREILCNVFRLPLRVPPLLEEATSLGAAMAAGVGVGMFSGYEQVAKKLEMEDYVQPNPETKTVYTRQFELFSSLYPALKQLFSS